MTKLMPFLMLIFLTLFVSCGPEDPEPENDEETITDITLFFDDASGNTLMTKAVDADGDGPEDIVFDATLALKASTEYTLRVEFFNGLANEDITEEVDEEGAEHQLFFGWSDGLFSQPEGTGNIDDASGQVNYSDSDENSLPIGLTTQWTTGTEVDTEFDFRIVLKHQPDIKSASSTAQDGESDVDLTFKLKLEN